MQSLIHGNFEGAARRRPTRWSAPSAAVGAAIGPLIGGFVTTYLSWRVGFLMEVVIIAIVLSGSKLVKDVPFTGIRKIDTVGAVLSIFGMGGIVLGILVSAGRRPIRPADHGRRCHRPHPARSLGWSSESAKPR